MTALTIAGSDSCGGAGIQRDIVTFADLGISGASAITCVTAQTPHDISAITPLPPDVVAAQISSALQSHAVQAIKTGMLYTAGIVETVAAVLSKADTGPLVVDPVLVSSSGTALLQDDARKTFVEELLPLAQVVTPNTDEAELLSGTPIDSVDNMKTAAREIAALFDSACVVTGGHLETGKEVHVILFAQGDCTEHTFERVGAADTHGTGCAFSAAITAQLALGRPLDEAVENAGRYVEASLKQMGS